MKKTPYIRLVLITAALASCNRPLYQQAVPPPDDADTTQACPIGLSDLPPDYYNWYYGFRPYGNYYYDPFRLDGFYIYRIGLVRGGFGYRGKTVYS